MIKVLGSFTGIRIGVSTAKAFNDAFDIPAIGISSLEALAYNVKLIYGENYSGLVCSIIDCKNSNCYYALFEFENGNCKTLINPSTDNIEKILDILSKYSNILFIGDGAILYLDLIKKTILDSSFIESSNNYLNSYALGLAGINNYNKGNFQDILPLYLKKPQAQRQLEEKLKKIESEKNNGKS